jgi:hypothetical protein
MVAPRSPVGSFGNPQTGVGALNVRGSGEPQNPQRRVLIGRSPAVESLDDPSAVDLDVNDVLATERLSDHAS